MLAFGISTKSWNWEDVIFLEWSAGLKGSSASEFLAMPFLTFTGAF